MNTDTGIVRADSLFYMDETFKLCYPKESGQINSNLRSFLLTNNFLTFIEGYAMITAIVLFFITPPILSPTNTSVLFYGFWDMLQITYLWSYHLASDSASRKIYKALNFVNFEFRILPPIFSRYLLRNMIQQDVGIKLLFPDGRTLFSDAAISIFQSSYEKYFFNEKIAVLLHDAASLFDTLTIIGGLSILFSILHQIATVIFKNETNPIRRLLEIMTSLFGKSLYVRLFVEIQPILMFHCLS